MLGLHLGGRPRSSSSWARSRCADFAAVLRFPPSSTDVFHHMATDFGGTLFLVARPIHVNELIVGHFCRVRTLDSRNTDSTKRVLDDGVFSYEALRRPVIALVLCSGASPSVSPGKLRFMAAGFLNLLVESPGSK